MKEFGSDFHYIIGGNHVENNLNLSADVNYYACGRHAINALILDNEWKRIWMPEYFCYHVIDSMRKTNIEILFYPDSPTSDDVEIIRNIPFKEGDVLFRMNYFGLRCFRDNSKMNVPIIEDHSHNLFSEWAKKSNADYCIASLRKTLPLTEGGVLWSPKGLTLPTKISSTLENDYLSSLRLNAMLLKKLYLDDQKVSKDYFRQLYLLSEAMFDDLEISGMVNDLVDMLLKIDIDHWIKQKYANWQYLFSNLSKKINILQPENRGDETPFSLVLKFQTNEERERVRITLIENYIYPAILWKIPTNQNRQIVELSDTLLSIPCDGRYDLETVENVTNIILTALLIDEKK